MAYVAVKGGERAIRNAHTWLAEERRGDPAVPELALDQIREQLGRAIDRVMAEGSLYDPDLAALAIKQAQGDLVEAIFLLRAAKAHAFIRGRAYVTPDDIKALGLDVLRHRVILTYRADAEGVGPDALLGRIFEAVPVP